MIALCLEHHKQADSGVYTNRQLRKAKLIKCNAVKSTIPWRREEVIFQIGSNFAYECSILIALQLSPLIWLSKDSSGDSLFNFDLKFQENSIFKMIDNDWIAWTDVDDLRCPPGGRSLFVSSKKMAFSLFLDFSDLSKTYAESLFPEISTEIPLQVMIKCELPYFKNIKINQTKIKIGENILISRNKFSHCNTAIGL